MPATTIALLPFLNMSSYAENEYFSDGRTEKFLKFLANIDVLVVLLFSNLPASE